MKTRRHHPDHPIQIVVPPQTSSHNVRIAPESPLPQPVTDHHIQREPRRLILRIERLPQLRFHPQHRKIRRRHPLILHPRWLRCTRQVRRPENLQHNILKNSRTLQIFKLRNRDARVGSARTRQIVLDAYQFLRVRIGQRMQQRRIDQAENRRGRADPQGHRQNRDSRKPRRLGQHAYREARVLQQVFKKRQPLLCVVILSHCPHPSELHHRLPPCLFRIHPRAQILLRLQGDMLLHLLPQPFVVSPPGGKVLEPRQKPSQKSHGKSSAFTSKNRPMIAAVCSQSCVSTCSCLRPSFVSR